MTEISTPAMRYIRSPDAIETQVNGESTVLHAVKWAYLEFNPVAQAVWRRLAEPASLGDLVAGLMAQFAVEEAVCRAEVAALLSELVDKGYITPA